MPYDPEYHRKYRAANKVKAQEYAKQYYEENTAKLKKYAEAYREENAEKVSAAKKKCYQNKKSQYLDRIKFNTDKNRDAILAYQSAYKKANRAYFNAYANFRSRRTRSATPAWADASAIAKFYTEATRLTEETGVPHQVDHIVPLVSDLVCGLNWEGNLQVLTAEANRRKKNVHWPDMP